jgi:phage terminase small subunit
MPVAPELTTKQARFIDEYLVDGNGAGAAVRAGYSPAGAHVRASRMLRNATTVARAIEARQAADATRLSIQREDVLKGLIQAQESAREHGDPAGMISALREIAKLMGFYPDPRMKFDVTVAADMNHLQQRMEAMSDLQLMALIGRAE